jgi:hypothetical protein
MGVGLAQAVHDSDDNTTQFNILVLGGAALAMAGGFMFQAASTHLWDAINIHDDRHESEAAVAPPRD